MQFHIETVMASYDNIGVVRFDVEYVYIRACTKLKIRQADYLSSKHCGSVNL